MSGTITAYFDDPDRVAFEACDGGMPITVVLTRDTAEKLARRILSRPVAAGSVQVQEPSGAVNLVPAAA